MNGARLLTCVCIAWAVAWVPCASAQGPQTANPRPRTASPDALDGRTVEELEKLIARQPRNPDLHIALGLAYWDRNDDARALESFQRAVKIGPRSAEAHNWLGVALTEKADLPQAIAMFRKAIALDPQYGRAYTNLGSALATSGDFDEAVAVFRKALTLEPNSIGARMNLGLALREKGDLDAALEHLGWVADADPGNASIHYELGQTRRQNGDMAGAIGSFERALEIAPEMREAYYALGVALKQQSASLTRPAAPHASPGDDSYKRARDAAARGELTVALDQLRDALRLDGNHAEAHNLTGFILGQQGDLPSALSHLERAIALRPESADAHYNFGVALWYSGFREKALAALRESVRLDPAAGPAYAFLGSALRETGDLQRARTTLQRAIALLPPTAAVYVDLGLVYIQDDGLAKALGQFEAALNAPSPAFPAPDWDAAAAGIRKALAAADDRSAETTVLRSAAHNLLGLVLGRNGAEAAAVAEQFREAIRLRSDFPAAHNNLGLVLIQAGDDPGGISALREAVRLDPDYADAHANLGAALTPTDPDEAIRSLEQAIRLAPASVKARFNLAIAYGASRAHGVAKEIEQLHKVIELSPDFARARVALGKALLRDGKVTEAVRELQEATRLEPKSGEAHYQLGLALARAGRKAEAAAQLEKGRALVAAENRNQNASLDIAEGRAALDRGALEDAAARFRRALEAQPDAAEAKRYLAVALDRQKRAADDPDRVKAVEGYIRQGQFKEVEPVLAEYLKERPASTWGWYALGYSLFAQQRIGESIKALARSLELDVTNAEAHKILGRNLMMIGRFDAAQVEFEQAIRYKPDSAESHYNLGKLFSIQDNWEPARTAFEAALRIDPSYIEAMDALGFALEALGDDAGAVAHYEKARALNEVRGGSFASPLVNLSAYSNRTGEADRALQFALEAIDVDPRSDRAWFQKAKADERRGDLEAAIDALNQAIVHNPRASSYYYVLAGLCRRLGLMDESRKALEMFKRLEQESAELDQKRRSNGAGAAAPSGIRRD